MMGRLNHDQEQFFYSFRLDEAVPNDHPVREVAAVLDLSWVHSELAPYYPRLGRPSIDPVLMAESLFSFSQKNQIDCLLAAFPVSG
jgi:transposase